MLQAYAGITTDESRKRGTVTRIRPESTMTPEENRPQPPQTRRSVRLPAPDEPVRHTARQESGVPAPARGGMKDQVLRVAERVVGDWAPTLRAAALRVALFALVLIAVGIAFGVKFAVLGAVVGFVMFLVGRRREAAG